MYKANPKYWQMIYPSSGPRLQVNAISTNDIECTILRFSDGSILNSASQISMSGDVDSGTF